MEGEAPEEEEPEKPPEVLIPKRQEELSGGFCTE
jgi:hypothetical protein